MDLIASCPTRISTRAPAALALLLLTGLLAAGCGGATVFRAPIRTGASVLSDSDRAERLALGAIDPDLATDPVEEIARMRRIAALELRVGNFGIAIEATRRALQVARANAALGPERDRSATLHREVRDEALVIAERAGSLELALEAIGRADPGPAREVLARLARARADAGGSLGGQVIAEPVVGALDDATRLDLERLGAELAGEPLALERLSQLGVRALPRLHQHLRAAARSGDGARLAELARAIRALDRWDPIARAIGHLEAVRRLDLAIDVATTEPARRQSALARSSSRARPFPSRATTSSGAPPR